MNFSASAILCAIGAIVPLFCLVWNMGVKRKAMMNTYVVMLPLLAFVLLWGTGSYEFAMEPVDFHTPVLIQRLGMVITTSWVSLLLSGGHYSFDKERLLEIK